MMLISMTSGWLPQHKGRTFAVRDQFIALIERAVAEHHDAVLRARLALAQFQHFGFHAQGIAMKYGLRESYFVHAEIGDGAAERRLAHGNADHEAQREQ